MEKLEKTGIKPIVIDEIRNLADKYQVKKVILFGSRARGDFYRASDIDLERQKKPEYIKDDKKFFFTIGQTRAKKNFKTLIPMMKFLPEYKRKSIS